MREANIGHAMLPRAFRAAKNSPFRFVLLYLRNRRHVRYNISTCWSGSEQEEIPFHRTHSRQGNVKVSGERENQGIMELFRLCLVHNMHIQAEGARWRYNKGNVIGQLDVDGCNQKSTTTKRNNAKNRWNSFWICHCWFSSFYLQYDICMYACMYLDSFWFSFSFCLSKVPI